MAVLISLGTGLLATLLMFQQANEAPPGKDRAALRADAIKTGLTIAAGTGGAVALLFAYRRQRLAERTQVQSEEDTRQRRITELYGQAGQLLSSDKAAVRLAGLHTLSRLAQDNVGNRQLVVDLLCAYLRMPYTPPPPKRRTPALPPVLGTPLSVHAGIANAPPPLDTHSSRPAKAGPDPVVEAEQELQVRLTAQRILRDHLSSPSDIDADEAREMTPDPAMSFWPRMRMDLRGATLVEFNIFNAVLESVTFEDATFFGSTVFLGATIFGHAEFARAHFIGDAEFMKVTFRDWAWFAGVHFASAVFLNAEFRKSNFGRAIFNDSVTFAGAEFFSDATFANVQFLSAARFQLATFHTDVSFKGAVFSGDVDLDQAIFAGAEPQLDESTITSLDNPTVHRGWPEGWLVHNDSTDSNRGRLSWDPTPRGSIS
jgi:uncharacterized protein YjbI with pentapeptide repeats